MDGSRSARRGESDGRPHRSHSDRSKSRVMLPTSYPPTHARSMVMNRRAIAAITGTVLIAALLVTGAFQWLGAEDEAALLAQAQAVFKPLPQDMGTPEFPTTPARVVLGQGLFFDPRWTVEGSVSCVTCHQPALYG